MQVWGACGELIKFENPGRLRPVAHIIENDLMLEAMHEQLSNFPNISIINGTGVTSCEFLNADEKPDVNSITTKQNETFTCDLLIGADGFGSTVRKAMEVNNFELSYNQMGVVATLKLENHPFDDIAYQRFIPGGPIALLPLSSNECSLVWTTSKEHAKELVKMSPNLFVDAINEAFNKKYEMNSLIRGITGTMKTIISGNEGNLTAPTVLDVTEGSRAMFPLGFGHASSYVRNGALLIGDAAHRIHPLAGQGVNLGFGDVLRITEQLDEAVTSGFKVNDFQYLLKYEQECLKANLPIMLGVHAIQRLYSSDSFLHCLVRSVGISGANFQPLKQFFMDRAYA